MAGLSQPRNIVLREQNVTEVPLMPSDAEILRSLNFEVLPARPVLSCVTELLVDHNWYAVNPKQYVGHLALQSGLVVIV